MEKKKRFLTGTRPTGALHIGHLAGAVSMWVNLQNQGKYDPFVFIADVQALTDNADNPEKIRNGVEELMLDYLACGLDPEKSTLFIQSQIPALNELTMYYMNLVTLARLERNPTVKTEILAKKYGNSIPTGFLTYPISQSADITAFDAELVPAGDDQAPMIEQAREIVRSFNRLYGETLVEPNLMLSEIKSARRIPGTDGNVKMGKSLGNCIYLKDEPDVIKQKIMSMYTDPNHIKVTDPGDTKNNPVFIYLDVFCKDREKFEEMKANYEKGGLGDVVCKKYLNEVMQEVLAPIRERRKELEKNMDYVYKVFEEGSKKANQIAENTLKRVREALGLEYFKNRGAKNE